jgi:hypothetical protein
MKRILALLILLSTTNAVADQGRDAGKHFQRGVDLYNDGDFRGALVEFKKAYATWPRANVLYDIGQTEYQLLDYAGALKTMERYLSETGPNAAHRNEVENTVEILRGRVGKVALAIADAPGCDVTVDDQPAGTTPLDAPLLVSVGLRKVAVTCAGRGVTQSRVEVAAGELVRVELKPPPPPIAAVRAAMASSAEARKASTKSSMTIAWLTTGALFLATAGLGTATLVEQNKLGQLRNTFPVQKDTLDRQAALTTGLAISTDVLGGLTAVGAAAATYLTIKYDKERRLHLFPSGRGLSVSGAF